MENDPSIQGDGDKDVVPQIVRVAICGEFRSGKSAVLNALFRNNALGDNVGSDVRPTVFAEFGDVASVEYFDASMDSVDKEIASDPESDVNISRVQVVFDNDDLKQFEFVEIPLSCAEELTDEQFDLVKSSDIMVWVTIASQAWRLTEKNIVDALDIVLPKHSILAVSRIDKLRKQSDREKLTARIEKETTEYFRNVVFMENSQRQIAESADSIEVWAKTGAPLLLESMNQALLDTDVEENEETSEVSPPEIIDDGNKDQPAKLELEADSAATTKAAEVSENLSHLVEDGMVAGMFPQETDHTCVPISGPLDECQSIGDTFRTLRQIWLDNYKGDLGNDRPEFEMTCLTKSHSLHFQSEPEKASIFMKTDLNVSTYGAAQDNFAKLCKGIV